jgi:hypothetical protein
VRDGVEGDDTGVRFGTGRMAAEAGQRVSVVVIVAYRARRTMALAL